MREEAIPAAVALEVFQPNQGPITAYTAVDDVDAKDSIEMPTGIDHEDSGIYATPRRL